MKVKTAYSQKTNLQELTEELKQQIGDFDTRLLVFFASPDIDPQLISGAIQNAFTGSSTMGCSTAGEITTGKMLDKSIVAMAFGPEIIGDCKIEVLENIQKENGQVDEAFRSFSLYFNKPTADLSPDEYVGMVFIDGLSLKEESINERIGDLTNVSFVGGSAGDDQEFRKTYIYANGETYTDAAVLSLIRTTTPFDILKTQSFEVASKKAVVTKADEANRKVMEINHKPATQAYAELLEVSEKEVAGTFFQNPIGLVFQDHIFVRSPQRAEGNDIYFYCSIKEGMELQLLNSGDIVRYTREDLSNKVEQMGGVSAIVNFNCILRTLELKARDQTEAYGDIFKSIPTVGFSTYGESYIGHINQTATMLLFR
jgi:hypothetical protein